MKTRHIQTGILVMLLALAVSSCEGFLSADPVDKFSDEQFGRSEDDFVLYADGMLQNYRPGASTVGQGDNYSDLVSSKSSTDFYIPGVWIPSRQGGWAVGDWRGIRRANFMMASLEAGRDRLAPSVYDHYMGVARFWRAWFYFTKVKTFGDVPWVDHVINDMEDPTLVGPRDDRERVMHHVLEDLDFACANLSGDIQAYAGAINRSVALAFKSRVCLYEGSFRKYHAVNPSTQAPWTGAYETSADWFRAAADAAGELMESGNHALDPVSMQTSSWTEEDASGQVVTRTFDWLSYDNIWRNTNFWTTPEAIWTAEYEAGELNVYHELTWVVNSATYDQQCAPTKNLVRMFLNLDGTPARGDVSINEEFEGRDWRLFNTVHGPGHVYRKITQQVLLKDLNFTYTNTGYQFRKWSQENEENYSKGRNDNDIPILRYAEVLLNYAEAKAELGEMTESIWDGTIGLLRTRAGVRNIWPGSADYVPDTWLRDYYGDPALSDVLLEIRRERVTEMILEGRRVDDLFRWRCGHLIVDRGTDNSGWMGFYVTPEEARNGLTFNGYKYVFDRAGATGYKVGTSTANSNFTFSEGDHGYLVYHYKLEWLDRDYVRPIPTAAYTKNPALGQNNGWEE